MAGGHRNLNLSSGGRRILGSPFNGVLAEDVPLTGDYGKGILADMISPADYGHRVSLRVTSVPVGITLGDNIIINEDSSVLVDASVPADTYEFGIQVMYDGANLGSPQTYTLTVGGMAGNATASGSGSGSLSIGPAALQGAATGAGIGVGNLAGGVPGAELLGAGSGSSDAPAALSTTAALGGQATGGASGSGHLGAPGASLGGSAVGGGSAYGVLNPGVTSTAADALTTPAWPFRRYKTTIRRTY